MHARLETDGAVIVASDGHPRYPAAVGENMGIAMSVIDKDRVAKVFKGPLAKTPWGAEVD